MTATTKKYHHGNLQEDILKRAAEIIDVLHHEKGASKPFVAGHLNCANSGGHWNSAWKSLRDNDLIEKRGDQFFLKGEIAG